MVLLKTSSMVLTLIPEVLCRCVPGLLTLELVTFLPANAAWLEMSRESNEAGSISSR